MTRLGQDSRWLTHVLESGSGAAGFNGDAGASGPLCSVSRRPPAEKEGPMPAFLFKLVTKVGRRGTPSGPPPETSPAPSPRWKLFVAGGPRITQKGGRPPKAMTTPQVSAPPHVCLGASRHVLHRTDGFSLGESGRTWPAPFPRTQTCSESGCPRAEHASCIPQGRKVAAALAWAGQTL